MHWTAEIFVGILGLVIGSFLNVCIHRIPQRKSIAFPSSHCPECKTPLGAADLVPVISYIALRGRCRTCGKQISPRYPVIEALTGLAFYLDARYAHGTLIIVKNATLLAALIVVCFVDLDHQIIPNRVVFPMAAAGIVFAALEHRAGDAWAVALFAGLVALLYILMEFQATPDIVIYPIAAGALAIALKTGRLSDPLLGFTAGYIGFHLILAVGSRLARKEAMGYGDVKLAGMLGIYLGWQNLLVGMFLAFLAGAAVSIALMLTRKKGMRDPIPFGPMMCIGAVAALVDGPGIIQWYAGLTARLWGMA